ncbi:hypothetical protein HN587_03645 [Candidatus Woesearchaeota archaeon]|nr:hypothetical protein [Candidatus Woesearchaeota archaeon]
MLEQFFNWASQYFSYTAGLWAISLIVPLIIIYLIKPRPRKKKIPALMFLMKENKKLSKNSLFQRLIKNPILLLQILIILIAAAAIAKPFILVSESSYVENTILVIDSSASMQAKYSGEFGDSDSRFKKAIELAQINLGEKNTVIIAASTPEIALKNEEKETTKSFLQNLKPKDTRSGLFDAILSSTNFAKEGDVVVVISDFIETESDKGIDTAKKILKSRGIKTQFISLIDETSKIIKNVGIISVEVSDKFTTVHIKNFNDVEETVGISVNGKSNSNISANQLNIDPKSQEMFSFSNMPGITTVKITVPGDEFELDNTAFVSTPTTNKVDLLYINSKRSKYLGTALDVLDNINLKEAGPPKISIGSEPIILLGEITPNLLLPQTFRNIEKKVKNGAALIITSHDDMFQIDYKGMLPILLNDDGFMNDSTVFIDQVNPLTKDINFGKISKHFNVSAQEGVNVIASTNTGVPILAFKKHDEGTVVYYGIFDENSDFKRDMYYPIFWKRLTDFLVNKVSLRNINKKTGDLLSFTEPTSVLTPTGNVKTNILKFTKQGVYELEDKKIVANLASVKESNINSNGVLQKALSDPIEKKEEMVPENISKYVIYGLLAFLFLELLALKIRGDI